MFTIPPIESLTIDELGELNFQLVDTLVRVNTAIRERSTGESEPRFHGVNFDNKTRTIYWQCGGKSFSKRAIRRFLLIRELLLSESGTLTGHEISQIIFGNESVPWDNIRKLVDNTCRDLETSCCSLRLEIEKECVRILET